MATFITRLNYMEQGLKTIKGNVRTETLRAFTDDEFRKIVSALP